MSGPSQTVEMEERFSPSRPQRLGTRRRKGATRREAPSSLDTEKQLATTGTNLSRSGRVSSGNRRQIQGSGTIAEALALSRSEYDIRREQIALQRQLSSTVHAIWQGHRGGKNDKEALKWEKQWFKLHNCQMEWIGYRASCCQGYTTPVAVPIGCNHRLCPLCAWHRSQVARKRIKAMFDRLTHPVLITLTVPNKDSIRKHDFTLMRQRVRQFIAQHKAWIRGGVYSLETTYNRTEKKWHIHCHILADVSASLPCKADKTDLAGVRVYAFTAIKLKLEFDWLRLWIESWGKRARSDASAMRLNADAYEFEEWVRAGRSMRIKEYRPGGWRIIDGLTQADILARTEWNKKNRRVIDVRPVLDRDGAAREVLKYITKVADFSDLKEAVEPFCNAVRGARLIQTFGSWYGVKLDTPPDPNQPMDWGELKCMCGLNMWERMGVFFRDDVEMDAAGCWHLRHSLDHRSRGTVARPTIRALEARVEEESQLCQMERR